MSIEDVYKLKSEVKNEADHSESNHSQLNSTEPTFDLNEGLDSGVVHSVSGEARAENGDFLMVADDELLKQLESIPSKMAFKIGEVAELAGVKQYVLRYWETEFDVLRPKKSNHNQRMYSRNDVEVVLLIKKLLYTDKYSISGARTAIRKLKKKVKKGSTYREAFKRYNGALEMAKQLVLRIEKVQASLR